MGTFLLWLRNRVLDQLYRGALSLKCVKLGNNPKFYGMRTTQCKVGKVGNVVERKHRESEEGLGWSTGPAPVKAQALTATLGLQGRSELLHTSFSTVRPYHCISRDRVLLWSPCLTVHKRKGFWDLILSPCCVFWGNSFFA